MFEYASAKKDVSSSKQELPTNFVTPSGCKKRDTKTSEKYESALRRTIGRESTQAPNDFESP